MTTKFEDTVKLLQTTKNPFDLSHHMGEIVEGLADALARIQKLEAGHDAPSPHVTVSNSEQT